MFTLWILLLISTVSTQDTETTTSSNTNITTLYPVFNKTITRNEIQTKPNDTETRSNDTQSKPKPFPQSWKIESAFAESNLTNEEINSTDAREEKVKEEYKISDVKERTEKKAEILKDFKPSQHLGSFFDEDSAEVIKTPIFGPVEKKPASGFVSSPQDEYHQIFNNIPKEIYYTHTEFPYKFDDTIFTKTKEGWPDSDSKPTVEVPMKVPAGELYYKAPETVKEKPHNDEDFAIEYHEDGGKENGIKKRVNPWRRLLQLVTAFIPVGLIISALTPSVITIHNVDNNQQPSLPYRRSDAGGGSGGADIAPISERCRRRLLCELQSERNYAPPSSVPRHKMKHCYKIHCEDTEALWRMLRWLFTYNQGDGDQRGRHFT